MKSTVLCVLYLIHDNFVLALEIFFWPQMSVDCSEAVEMDKDVAAFSWNHNVHVATGTKNHS